MIDAEDHQTFAAPIVGNWHNLKRKRGFSEHGLCLNRKDWMHKLFEDRLRPRRVEFAYFIYRLYKSHSMCDRILCKSYFIELYERCDFSLQLCLSQG